mgnify:CR=1 FL=1
MDIYMWTGVVKLLLIFHIVSSTLLYKYILSPTLYFLLSESPTLCSYLLEDTEERYTSEEESSFYEQKRAVILSKDKEKIVYISIFYLLLCTSFYLKVPLCVHICFYYCPLVLVLLPQSYQM